MDKDQFPLKDEFSNELSDIDGEKEAKNKQK